MSRPSIGDIMPARAVIIQLEDTSMTLECIPGHPMWESVNRTVVGYAPQTY